MSLYAFHLGQILPFASNRKIQTFFHVCLRFKRTRWAGQTCVLTRNNQLV